MVIKQKKRRIPKMKYKKKLQNLEARIKAWEARGGQNKESGHLHKRPGSKNK